MREVSRRNKLRKKRMKRLRAIIYIAISLIVTLVFGSWYFLYEASAETENLDQEKQPKNQVQQSKEDYSTLPENERKQKEIEDYLTKKKFNGTVYIENKGKYIFQKGFGYANVVSHRKNTPNTVYYIGSAQKSIIATAVLQLQEKGLLNIKDPVAKYLPKFPNGHKIKIENLLSHTSGLKSHKSSNRYISPRQLISSIEKAGVKRPPGKWEYHDENYAVAAYLIQQVSKMPLDEYIQKNIFAKAGMTDAGFGESFQKKADRAYSYRIKGDKLLSLPVQKDISQFFGAGDMYLSSRDAALYDKALASGSLISQASYKRQLKKGSHKYGFGFYDLNSYHIARGVLYGYEASNAFSKDHKLIVVLLGNARTSYDHYKLTKDILNIIAKN